MRRKKLLKSATSIIIKSNKSSDRLKMVWFFVIEKEKVTEPFKF